LAALYETERRYSEAEPLFRRDRGSRARAWHNASRHASKREPIGLRADTAKPSRSTGASSQCKSACSAQRIPTRFKA
jgi:hypothetical protein